MTARECADNWKRVIEIYRQTSDGSPKITAEQIIKELGKDDALTTFSTIAHIKKHDGRIYGNNRKVMDNTPYVVEATDWESGTPNPMRYAGLDDIHTSHINQIITYLIKEEKVC